MHQKVQNSNPTLVPLSSGSSLSSNAFDPAQHTASDGALGAAVAASEVKRLQVIAANYAGMTSRSKLTVLALTWANAYNALQTATAKGASATVAEMRTALDAFLVADDAFFGSPWIA